MQAEQQVKMLAIVGPPPAIDARPGRRADGSRPGASQRATDETHGLCESSSATAVSALRCATQRPCKPSSVPRFRPPFLQLRRRVAPGESLLIWILVQQN